MQTELKHNGMTYLCNLGHQAPEPENMIPGGVYLDYAMCLETGEAVGEGHIFDELERMIWKQAKAGYFDREPEFDKDAI